MIRRTVPAAVFAGALLLGACGDDDGPSGPDLDCTGGAPLAVGNTVNGTLAPGDDLDLDGAFLDRYALEVPRSGSIEITMTSTELDSFIWLLESDGEVIDWDDDSAGGVDARLVTTLSAGCYLVEATTWDDQTGPYQLTVRRL